MDKEKNYTLVVLGGFLKLIFFLLLYQLEKLDFPGSLAARGGHLTSASFSMPILILVIFKIKTIHTFLLLAISSKIFYKKFFISFYV